MEAALPCLIIPEGAEEVVAVDHQPEEPEEEVEVAALPWKSSPAGEAAAEAGVHPPHEAEAGVPPSAAAPVEAGEAAAGDHHQREAAHSNAARR